MGTRYTLLAEVVLTSIHNICFGSKIRKIGIPLYTPVTDKGSLPEIAQYSPYYLPLNVLQLPKDQTIISYLLYKCEVKGVYMYSQ